MKSENINLDGMNQQEFHMPPLEVRKRVRRNGSKRRLVLLIILLICTLSLLGSATYAWFTANKLVKIEDLQIRVNVSNGLEISSDAITWSQAITTDDLRVAAGLTASYNSESQDAGAINFFPAELHNISSIGNIAQYSTSATTNNNRLELFTGTASTICDVPDPANPGETKSVGVSNGNGYSGTSLSDCVIGEYFADLNGDGKIDRDKFLTDGVTANPDYEGDGENHLVTTGLVSSAPYSESKESCSGAKETSGGCQTSVDIIAFDVYLKLDEPSNIKLAQGSSITNIGADDYGLKNTLRVAFVTLGTQPAAYYYANDEDIENFKVKDSAVDLEQTVNGAANEQGIVNQRYKDVFGGYAGKFGARTMNAFGSISIWEPNANQHTKAALENAHKNYGMPEGDLSQTMDYVTQGIYSDLSTELASEPLELSMTNLDNYPEYFAKQQLVTDITAANTKFHEDSGENSIDPYKNKVNYFKTNLGEVGDENETITSSKGSIFLFSAPRGVTKLRIYIWVEGNDIDTENNATAATANVNLMFTSALKPGEGSNPGETAPTYTQYEVYNVANSKSGDKYEFRTTPTLGPDVDVLNP